VRYNSSGNVCANDKFIKEIIKNENIDVYIKGGNVIGLQVLKIIYDKYKNDDINFKKYFKQFLELKLIKDWDFASYTKKNITEEYRTKLDKIAKKNNLVPRAKRFILYQTKKPILTDNKALFEIAILENDCGGYSCMEIPLTTMKMRINEFNIKYIFMLAKIFHTDIENIENINNIDFNLLKRLISKITVTIHPCKNGFYNDFNNIDTGNLSDDMIKFIKKYSEINKNLPQFLITHIKDPYRLLYRLTEKNIPKTNKIQSFLLSMDNDNITGSSSNISSDLSDSNISSDLSDSNISSDLSDSNISSVSSDLSDSSVSDINVNWLFDTNFVKQIIEGFTVDLGNEISKIYKNNGFDDVIKFLNGVDWVLTDIEYKKSFSEYGKMLLNNILYSLIEIMGSDKIKELDSKNKFFHLLQNI